MKLITLLSFLLFSLGSSAQINRNVSKYNLQGDLGLKGYDPVAVFPEGGSKAVKGLMSLSLLHEGVSYQFGSQKNLNLFKANPEKFEPTYGGWCAYAMASGSTVDIDPTLFTIHGDRAHFFISSRAKRNFDSDIAGYEKRADGHWERISGEKPRK